jgi:hypothetical protein
MPQQSNRRDRVSGVEERRGESDAMKDVLAGCALSRRPTRQLELVGEFVGDGQSRADTDAQFSY